MDIFSHCPEHKDSSVVDGYSLDQWICTPPVWKSISVTKKADTCKLNHLWLLNATETYELSNGTRRFVYTHAKIKVIFPGQWNCETFYNLSNIDSKSIALLNVSSGPRETMITFLDQKVVLVSVTFIQPSVTALFLVTIVVRLYLKVFNYYMDAGYLHYNRSDSSVLLVADFATANGDGRILSSLCLTLIFNFIHGDLKFSGVS